MVTRRCTARETKWDDFQLTALCSPVRFPVRITDHAIPCLTGYFQSHASRDGLRSEIRICGARIIHIYVN